VCDEFAVLVDDGDCDDELVDVDALHDGAEHV